MHVAAQSIELGRQRSAPWLSFAALSARQFSPDHPVFLRCLASRLLRLRFRVIGTSDKEAQVNRVARPRPLGIALSRAARRLAGGSGRCDRGRAQLDRRHLSGVPAGGVGDARCRRVELFGFRPIQPSPAFVMESSSLETSRRRPDTGCRFLGMSNPRRTNHGNPDRDGPHR